MINGSYNTGTTATPSVNTPVNSKTIEQVIGVGASMAAAASDCNGQLTAVIGTNKYVVHGFSVSSLFDGITTSFYAVALYSII